MESVLSAKCTVWWVEKCKKSEQKKNSWKKNTRSSKNGKNYRGHYLTGRLQLQGESTTVFPKEEEIFENKILIKIVERTFLTWIKQILPLPPVDRVEHLDGVDGDPLAQRRAALRRRRVPPAGGANPVPEDPGGQLGPVGAPLGGAEGVGQLGEDGGDEGVTALEAEDAIRWFWKIAKEHYAEKSTC